MSSSLRQKGEQTKGEIQEHFQSLRENLVKTEQELLSGTDKIISEKVAALGEQEKQLKEMHEELDFEVSCSSSYKPWCFMSTCIDTISLSVLSWSLTPE